jgi:hypothetical protein
VDQADQAARLLAAELEEQLHLAKATQVLAHLTQLVHLAAVAVLVVRELMLERPVSAVQAVPDRPYGEQIMQAAAAVVLMAGQPQVVPPVLAAAMAAAQHRPFDPLARAAALTQVAVAAVDRRLLSAA